jgi:hypothetical protein
MHAAADRGDVPRKVVDEFDRESKGKKLPERARKKANPSVKPKGKPLIDIGGLLRAGY